MKFRIVYVGTHDLSQWSQELDEFIIENNEDITITTETFIPNVYDYIYAQDTGIVIIDTDFNETFFTEFVSLIKREKELSHIAIFAIIPKYTNRKLKKVLRLGVDRVISRERLNSESFFLAIRPLVLNALFIAENILRAAQLQEKAVTDIVMLELLKDYIPKTIWQAAEECADNHSLILPSGEKEATVVFGDIADFTKMSEIITPEQAIENLNAVYEIITRYVYKYDGDIDKFIGDAFFAIFESPFKAVKSMVLIQKEIQTLNEQRKKDNLDELYFRISIHTGPVIRGNVGGNNRYDNTLIGDTVNTASRLEKITPRGNITITEQTRERIKKDIPKELLSTIQLRGKKEQVMYYTVFDHFIKDTDFIGNE